MTGTVRAPRTALLVVDVQNDFCEGGSLGVTGGSGVAAAVTDHLAAERDRYAVVVTSQDWHRPSASNGGHFALPPDHPDFRETWPAHCVAETPGAALHPSLEVTDGAVAVRKGWGVPAYSAFEGRDGAGRELRELVAAADVSRVVVCGIATAYCVSATARDALRYGFAVDVRVDLTAAVDPTGVGVVLDALTTAGVRAV